MTNNVENSKKVSEACPNENQATAPLFTRKKLWGALGGILILSLCVSAFFIRPSAMASLNDDQAALDHALAVNTTTIQAVTHYQVKQKYSGSIVAGRESDHGFDRAGLLADILVDEGAKVKKGDILAHLDMRRFDARARELDASLVQTAALEMESKALFDRAEANFSRYQVLLEKKHISEQKFDQVKFDLIALKARKAAAEAAVTKAQAALESLKIERDMATLTARFDGSVIRRYLDEGSTLGAGTPVIRLIEDSKLEIHVGLPATAVAALIMGKDYKFNYQGGDIITRLRAILKRLDQSTRTVTAIFDVATDSMNIRAGDLAQLALNKDIQQAGFWLPSSALAESRRGLWSVYSLKPYKGYENYATLSRQELQVLYTDANRVFVRGTLQDGDRIITGGIHRLAPNQLVRIAKEN